MIYKYEIACKEAGLTEEQIVKIRQVFDSNDESLELRKEEMERNEISWINIMDSGEENQETDFELADPDIDVEASVVHRLLLHELRRYMMEFSERDREFLYGCFEDDSDANVRMAKRFHMTIDQVRYKKNKMVEELRKKFRIQQCS